MRSILAWIECEGARGGGLTQRGLAAAAVAQRIGSLTDREVSAVVLGDGASEAARLLEGLKLTRLLSCEAPGLVPYTPEPWRDVLLRAVEETDADWLVAAHAYRSHDLLPAVAEALGAAWIPEVNAHRLSEPPDGIELRRPLAQGRLEAWVRPRGERAVITLGAHDPTEPLDGECRVERLQVSQLTSSRRRVVERRTPDATVDLGSATRIVAVGRGLGGPDRLGPIEELARCLDAELAGSRPVIDAGWLERERQVGSSGQTVAPDLYLALGISGAMQHLQGMHGSRCIVAVNKDSSAPILQSARFAIVGDLHEIVPALIAALRDSEGTSDGPGE